MYGSSVICPICGNKVLQLTKHIKNVHQENDVPCESCDKTFKSVSLKINHVINVHGLFTSCLLCEKTFPSNAYLKAHIRTVHGRERQFSCEYCNNKFLTKAMLKLHDEIFCPIKFNLKCKQCDKLFEKKSSLNIHLKVHEIKLKLLYQKFY